MIETLKYLYEVLNLFDEFQIPVPIFDAFVTEVAGKYFDNEYHNFNHGMDVCYTVYRLLMDSKVHLVFSQLELFSILTGKYSIHVYVFLCLSHARTNTPMYLTFTLTLPRQRLSDMMWDTRA